MRIISGASGFLAPFPELRALEAAHRRREEIDDTLATLREGFPPDREPEFFPGSRYPTLTDALRWETNRLLDRARESAPDRPAGYRAGLDAYRSRVLGTIEAIARTGPNPRLEPGPRDASSPELDRLRQARDVVSAKPQARHTAWQRAIPKVVWPGEFPTVADFDDAVRELTAAEDELADLRRTFRTPWERAAHTAEAAPWCERLVAELRTLADYAEGRSVRADEFAGGYDAAVRWIAQALHTRADQIESRAG